MAKEERKDKDKDKDIINCEYIKRKIDTFLNRCLELPQTDNVEELKKRDEQIIETMRKIVNQIDEHIENDKKDKLYHYKKYFWTIIFDMNSEIEFNKRLKNPIKTDLKPYNERVYSKLNYIFRKTKLLSEDEARIVYDDNYDDFFAKYETFFDLIDWLNDKGFNIIPEKTLFSAYLGISVETYNNLLKGASNNEVRNLFRSADEFFTTNQFGALINNDRKSIERIQKVETYGQEMRQTQPDNLIIKQTNNLSYNEIMLQLESKRKNVIDYNED